MKLPLIYVLLVCTETLGKKRSMGDNRRNPPQTDGSRGCREGTSNQPSRSSGSEEPEPPLYSSYIRQELARFTTNYFNAAALGNTRPLTYRNPHRRGSVQPANFAAWAGNGYISKLQAVEPRGFFSSFKSLYSCNFYSYGIIQTLLCALSIANPVWYKTHFASVLRPLVSQFTRPPFLFLFVW